MADDLNLVVPKPRNFTELQYHAALVAGLARVAGKIGRGNLADKSGRTTRSLDKLFSGGNTDVHGFGLLQFLSADPSALDEVLALCGYGLHPLNMSAGDDFDTVANTAEVLSKMTDAMRDGSRDHRETIEIANKARPVVASLHSIIGEADKLRGVA